MITHGSRSTPFPKDQCWRRGSFARPQAHGAPPILSSARRSREQIGAST